MNVSIEVTGDLLKYLDGKVGKGYTSRSEVARDAFRKLMQEDLRRQARLKAVSLGELEESRGNVAEKIIREKYGHYL